MLSIGKFAAAANVGVETVRYYQRKGLLAVPDTRQGMRRYGDEDLRRLKFIRKAQSAGFTLAEISELLALDASRDRKRASQLAASRIAELDDKIQELQRARMALTRLAAQCAQDKQGPCPILEAFEV